MVLLARRDPALLAERLKGLRAEGVEPWDRRITVLAGGLMLLSWAVAGLDVRWDWTGAVSLPVHLAGLLATVVGHGLFLWAMVSNPFFSKGVRIQSERGHTVARGGPYRLVRHPGYAGTIVAALGTPMLLGSAWALVPSAALAALFVLRTSLEDRVLVSRLPGYGDYSRQVRQRLVPGIW